MIGTIINAALIIIGGLASASSRWHLSTQRQLMIRAILGVFTVYVGLKLVWTGMNGTFWVVCKQMMIVLFSMSLGKIIGKLTRLQSLSNQVGEYAKRKMAPGNTSTHSPNRVSDGFVVSASLLCAAPLGILGALQDGLAGNWQYLAIKGVMDGLAIMGFASMFGRGVIAAVVPVVAWQGLLTLAAKCLVLYGVLPNPSPLLDAVHITCGLLGFSVALIVLQIGRVEIAAYLPSLIIAPLLTKWWL